MFASRNMTQITVLLSTQHLVSLMLEAANGTGSGVSFRLAIPAFWKRSNLSGNIRHETPAAYAAYRT
jgi:hypothetical protein